MIEIILDGPPRGKGRPRFRVIKGRNFVHTYTDSKTRDFENRLRSAAIEAMKGREPFSDAVVAVMQVLIPIPSSWSKADKEAARRGEIRPISKPDVDNFLKGIDALNGVVWRDDSQIVHASVSKFYSLTPMLKIAVQPIGDF